MKGLKKGRGCGGEKKIKRGEKRELYRLANHGRARAVRWRRGAESDVKNEGVLLVMGRLIGGMVRECG